MTRLESGVHWQVVGWGCGGPILGRGGGILSWFCTPGPLSAGLIMPGGGMHRAPITPGTQSPRPARGCRPLAWQRLVPAGKRLGAGVRLPRRERSSGQAPLRADLPHHGIPLTVPTGPGRPQRDTSPGVAGPAFPRGRRARAAGSPAPGALHSSRIPRIRSRREERPRAPRMDTNRAALPQETAQRGLPQGHLERPDRPDWGAGSGRLWLPASFLDADSFP